MCPARCVYLCFRPLITAEFLTVISYLSFRAFAAREGP